MMKMVLAAAAMAATIPAAQAATAVDVSALNGVGTTVALAAGTYNVTFTSGAYQAWNAWSNVSGCDGNGANCSQGWLVSLQIDTGNMGAFDRTQGSSYYFSNGANYPRIFSTAGAALAEAQTGAGLMQAALADYANPNAFTAASGITFTLSSAQLVNFAILDTPYGDNSGGVSILLSNAVPEPATWALMILGFGAVAAAMRRQRTRVRFGSAVRSAA